MQSILRQRSRILILLGLSIFALYILIRIIPSESNENIERVRKLLLLAEHQSFCSKRAAQRGFNQHVLSVSAYESTDNIGLTTNLTWTFINIFVKEAKKFYPKWVVRIYYYNLISKTSQEIQDLEALYDNVDFCASDNLPVLGNVIKKLPGKMQRFIPSIDPFVGVTIVRDLDSEIFKREVDAVNEWLSETKYAFHVMRDHYMHNIHMPGGLWGVASNRLSYQDRLTIANALLPSDDENVIRQFYQTYAGAGDQSFLGDHIFPLARSNSIAHDSFSCFWSRYVYRMDTRPFPSKRQHPNCFVGCPQNPCCPREIMQSKDYTNYRRCPWACRPKEHKDWEFC